MANPDAIYTADGERIVASPLARGPWDPDAQHGGPPSALIMRALEQLPGGEEMVMARVTYELLRPVPLGDLTLTAEVIRPGRRVQVSEATLRSSDGTEVMRARALKVRPSPLAAGEPDDPAPPPPTAAGTSLAADFGRGKMLLFGTHGIEIRFVEGAFEQPGPATAWFRLRVPLVAGETPSPLQRLAATADFPNGISAVLDWSTHTFINPELTLYVERAPVGEWIALRAETRIRAGGIGFAEGVLFDERGRVGRCAQALLVMPR